jgi:tRNA(fMet)-specific endonuclease VapC
MRYLVDTNTGIYFFKNVSQIGQKLRETPTEEIAVCSIVWAELLHGACKYGHPDRRRTLVRQTLGLFESLPFDDEAAVEYATIRHELETRGLVIGPNDLMIAAIAKAHDLIVVTRNREFERVKGVETEDWLA